MTKFLSKVFIIFSLLLITVSEGICGDIKLPTSFKAKDQQLILTGTGVRQKFLIDLFTGGLYLKSKCSDGAKVINANELMAIKIQVTSDVITSKRLEDNMRSEFKRVTNGKLGPYKARIEELVKAFKEDIKIGDTFDLVYHPTEGLKIYKNNSLKTQVAGLDFKQMVFSTWLGEDPADNGLKKGMLGV
jgi:hypothetical protein